MSAADMATYIGSKIDASTKSARQIAAEAGFSHPNFLSMLRKGHAKLPFDRVEALALALGIPPTDLMDRYLRAYKPDVQPLIARTYARSDVTPAELVLLRVMRRVMSGAGTSLSSTPGAE